MHIFVAAPACTRVVVLKKEQDTKRKQHGRAFRLRVYSTSFSSVSLACHSDIATLALSYLGWHVHSLHVVETSYCQCWRVPGDETYNTPILIRPIVPTSEQTVAISNTKSSRLAHCEELIGTRYLSSAGNRSSRAPKRRSK